MVLRVTMTPDLDPLPPSENISNVTSSPQETAKQRASVKWVLSKAYNNRVPENLREPFYRDHEDQEHLKPPIIGMLASAELYCLALSNMYSDPNYHNLNHWNIIQSLIRKGVQVPDPPDCSLTETVLIQTNPLKMSAHMTVIESLMVLYGREVGTRDRVSAAIRRWGGKALPTSSAPVNAYTAPHEESLLCWVSSACDVLRQQYQDAEEGDFPNINSIDSLRNLCDGVALAGLISLYCPDALPVSQIRAPRLASVHDSIHNLTLVYNFCQKHLPYNVFHMMPEDITYMRGSMHQNLLVMLADLFNSLEIHPAKCVRFPGSQPNETPGVGLGAGQSNVHGVVHKRCLPPAAPVPIPDLRSGLHTPPPNNQQPFTVTRSPSASLVSRGRTVNMNSAGQGMLHRSACSTPERRSASPQHSGYVQQDDGFVVHRGRAVPTLSSVVRQSENEGVAAGRPSNWEEQRRSSYAGRRSRRSSINAADDSQLTVENFGGSQDRLNFVGRNPEKELATVGSHHSSPRKISAPAGPIEPSVPVRSSLQDARGSIDFFYNESGNGATYPVKRIEDVRERHLERQYSKPEEAERIIEHSFPMMKRQMSTEIVMSNHNLSSKPMDTDPPFYLNNNNKDVTDGEVNKMASFSDLNKFRGPAEQPGIQLGFMHHGREDSPHVTHKINRYSNHVEADKKMTSFGGPPNTTTWQQQSLQSEQNVPNCESNQHPSMQESPPMSNGNAMAAQLNNIRLKLEEKKRRIEHEKKRMELALTRQRQQVGQQAFLQAVTKNKGNVGKLPIAPGVGEFGGGEEQSGGNAAASSAGSDGTSQSSPSPSHPSNPARPMTLQDISSDVQTVENKWLDQDGSPFVETRRTPDLDGMALEDYHQSIAKMNSSLQDIQTDIARLATQQNQIQANQYLQQQVYQPQQVQPSLQHNQYGSQHNINSMPYGLQHSNFGSSPHIPHDQQMSSSPHRHHHMDQQFYLHDRHQAQPAPPPRRTWAQQAQLNHNQEQRVWQSPHNVQMPQQPQFHDINQQRGWGSPSVMNVQPQEMRTWGSPQGFVLHEGSNMPYQMPNNNQMRYQNGAEHNIQNSNHLSYTISSPSQAQQPHLAVQSLFTQNTPPAASPQHRASTPQRQQSLSDLPRHQGAVSLQQLSNPETTHTPIKAPSIDDMEPQNISFIGNAEDEALQQGIGRLNITSGSRTYRIPSPTRPSLSRNSFTQPPSEPNSNIGASLDQGDQVAEKGFYISFDSEQPKRPKPPLRAKRGSPKKDRISSSANHSPERDAKDNSGDDQWPERIITQRHVMSVDQAPPVLHRETPRVIPTEDKDGPAAIIIGADLSNPNPETAEEMERKKERIMMLSLQRRQAAEEARARAEAAADARRQRESAVADEKAARKEFQAQRREAILQQYKLKKAIEEAEREGKVLDKAELNAMMKPSIPHSSNNGTMGSASGTKMRPKIGGAGTRARPKTIHVDSGAVQMAEGILTASRGKQGSSSNLTAGYNQPSSQSTMRRDYYRGSQDSLADRAGLYRDSPIDESRGMSPGSGASGLGRRGSYKTSRENVNAPGPQAQTRGRSKYSTYQNNFKTGRKSSSLMNLCGSSSEQDSMVLRYGDADSGLGRATPPRRAPSPGIRTLPSPSGPGSLPPGLITKRRNFDDNSSDISSTPSSIMDYSGPRLYKQPTTKSNRGIMLNAVEYCVFPGVVNKEAKRRVIDEINNSESKHFLVLFRDAGCQFRALYSFCPDREEVYKLYGTGPRQVNDRMFDKFFKYNSGSKCFSQVHTKHLTVTIDAFTIHNSLWQGKKVQLPSKKDMALVI